MRDYDLSAADEQRKERDHSNPVRYTHHRTMAGIPGISERTGG
jgi:hypothetical protein